MPSILKLFQKKERKETYCAAVVPAAGSSTRMEGLDKVLLPLGDYPILVRTLRELELCPYIQEIVVVTREDLIVPVSQLCKDFALSKVTKVVVGGASRPESVLAGIRETSDCADLIAIHDGARPFVTQAVLKEVIQKAAKCGAAAPAVPVIDTIKRAHHDVVIETPNREELYAVQTPQVFEASLIKGALHQALVEQWPITDDCSSVERLGMSVCLTQGTRENIKLTTPTDLQWGLGILNGRGEVL